MSTTDQQRKAAARDELSVRIGLYRNREKMEAIDAYARACIAEAVAPALEYLGKRIGLGIPGEGHVLYHLQKLLTEGRE